MSVEDVGAVMLCTGRFDLAVQVQESALGRICAASCERTLAITMKTQPIGH